MEDKLATTEAKTFTLDFFTLRFYTYDKIIHNFT